MTAGEQRSFSYFSGDWTYRFSCKTFSSKHALRWGTVHFLHIQYCNSVPLTHDPPNRNDGCTLICTNLAFSRGLRCFEQICVIPETTRTCWGSGTVAPSLVSLAPVLMATVSLSPPAIRTGQTNGVEHSYFSKQQWSIVTFTLIFNTCIITISRWSVFEKSRTLSAFHEAILSYQCVCRPLT